MGFSVLMSVYNKEKPEYLQEALDSVINQTLQCEEIVLIEDGPLTKELYEVISKYKDTFPFLKTFAFPHNVKLGNALRKGVELCHCDIIARMDTDDIAIPGRFELQYNFLKSRPDVTLVGGYIEEFENGCPETRIKKMPEVPQEIVKYARYRNPVNHMTVMFRKKDILSVGNYVDFPFLEDYHLWCRLLAQGYRLCNIPSVLVKARTSNEMDKRRGGVQYFKNYCKLRRLQKEKGLLTYKEYIIAVLCSFVVTILPSDARRIVYKRWLRRSK